MRILNLIPLPSSYIRSRTAAGGDGVRCVGDQGLLQLVLVAVEVVEQVPGGGKGQLAGTDGAHLVVGKRVHVELVHHGVELDQFLQLSLENET